MTQPYSNLSRVPRLLASGVELEGNARSVIQFEDLLPEAILCVGYAPIDVDGPVGVLVDVPPKAYDLVHLVVHLAGFLYAEYGGGLRHPLCLFIQSWPPIQ